MRRHKDQPFFLYYALTLPHAKYEIDDLGQYAQTDWTPQQKAYAAMVTRLDRDVGRLLDVLQELQLDDRTLVFLAGDNGSSFEPQSELGRRFQQAANGLRGYKRTLYEGGLRQAALVRWPGRVPAGRVCDNPWAFWDFLPTAVELAGAKLPPELKPDGSSLVPLLRGEPGPQREFFYWELHEGKPLQAVRFGDWKAVRNGPASAIELYDLKSDTGESHDVAVGNPDVVARAAALMKAARTDDLHWPLVASPAKKGQKPAN